MFNSVAFILESLLLEQIYLDHLLSPQLCLNAATKFTLRNKDQLNKIQKHTLYLHTLQGSASVRISASGLDWDISFVTPASQ